MTKKRKVEVVEEDLAISLPTPKNLDDVYGLIIGIDARLRLLEAKLDIGNTLLKDGNVWRIIGVGLIAVFEFIRTVYGG